MKLPLIGVGPELMAVLAVAFIAVYATLPFWIKKMHLLGIVGHDMNKKERPDVAEMGGVPVMLGFVLSVFLYVGIGTFFYGWVAESQGVLIVLSTILLMTVIGMIDDILGWKKGLRHSHKVLLTIPAALPLMVIKAGTSTMFLPFIGAVDLGLLYPLLVVPVAIVIASNAFNMLAGYNGLEASMGIMLTGALGAAAWITGQTTYAMVAFCMTAALAAFLMFNKFPAKVFPGDTLTYSVGALAAAIAILSNLEKMLVVLYLLYVVDFFLPLRKRMRVEAFAKVREDGGLEAPYEKIYDSTHFALKVLGKVKKKVSENDVVAFIIVIQAAVTALAFGVMLWF